MRKAGAKDYKNYSKKVLNACRNKPSLEVFADKNDEMIELGFKINSWGKNVYVKFQLQIQKENSWVMLSKD